MTFRRDASFDQTTEYMNRVQIRLFSLSSQRNGLLSSLFASSSPVSSPAPLPRPSFELARNTRHRPITEADNAFIRRVSDGNILDISDQNPGVRVHTNLLISDELDALETTARSLCSTHGIDLIDPFARASYESQMRFLRQPPKVNMLRVTGRPELASQRKSEWGYGDDFWIERVPGPLRTLIERIQSLDGVKLGKPRDVTINRRTGGFFRLDPHLDPQLDGGSIFILSLTAGTVITLSPLDLLKEIEKRTLENPPLEDPDWKKGTEFWRSIRSYTPMDLDVHLPLHATVQLSDDARWTWTHATRLGVEIELEGKRKWGLADWWGDRTRLIPRQDERISVVVAFGDP